MFFNDPWNSWQFRSVAHAVFAAFAGAMGYLMRTMDGQHKVRKRLVLMNAAAAGFVGILVMFICQEAGLSSKWTAVIVGVSGWMGANVTIGLLQSFVLKKLGLSKVPKEQSAENKDDQPSG